MRRFKGDASHLLGHLGEIEALDEVAFLLRRSSARAQLLEAIDGLRSKFLRRSGDYVPPLGPLPRDLAWAHDENVTITEVPWPAARGTVVALARRGRSRGVSAHVHVASGAPRTRRLDVLEAVLVAIEAARPQVADYARLAALIDECERDDHRANAEASARFAISCAERARAIPEARQVALAFLKEEAGIVPIELAKGTIFDPERHRPEEFERKIVHGKTGCVVSTELTGFKDPNGVVLSRAIVGVGGGLS
jgi:hypothetical protein